MCTVQKLSTEYLKNKLFLTCLHGVYFHSSKLQNLELNSFEFWCLLICIVIVHTYKNNNTFR